MEENGNGHGGKREGSGRKPKADEIALIERLKPMDEIALKLMEKLLLADDQSALKLFMSYRFGQPRQTIDANVEGGLLVEWFEQKRYETK